MGNDYWVGPFFILLVLIMIVGISQFIIYDKVNHMPNWECKNETKITYYDDPVEFNNSLSFEKNASCRFFELNGSVQTFCAYEETVRECEWVEGEIK